MTDSKDKKAYQRAYYQKHKEQIKLKQKQQYKEKKEVEKVMKQLSDTLDIFHSVGLYEGEAEEIDQFEPQAAGLLDGRKVGRHVHSLVASAGWDLSLLVTRRDVGTGPVTAGCRLAAGGGYWR